jgi:toxin ParE1/3/4
VKRLVRSAARDDIIRQYRYYLVTPAAPYTAQRFLEAVDRAINLVCHQPRIGALIGLNNPKLAGVRSWPVKGFEATRIYYLASAAELRISRVLHGKRDLKLDTLLLV